MKTEAPKQYIAPSCRSKWLALGSGFLETSSPDEITIQDILDGGELF